MTDNVELAKKAGFKVDDTGIKLAESMYFSISNVDISKKLEIFASLLREEFIKELGEPVAWRLTHHDGGYEIVTRESWQNVKESAPLYALQKKG